MASVLVLYYSSCGHIEKMAEAELDAARYQGRHVAQIAAKLRTGLEQAA